MVASAMTAEDPIGTISKACMSGPSSNKAGWVQLSVTAKIVGSNVVKVYGPCNTGDPVVFASQNQLRVFIHVFFGF